MKIKHFWINYSQEKTENRVYLLFMCTSKMGGYFKTNMKQKLIWKIIKLLKKWLKQKG